MRTTVADPRNRGASEIPLLGKGGVAAPSSKRPRSFEGRRRARSASAIARSLKRGSFKLGTKSPESTTPSAPRCGGFAPFSLWSRPPLLGKEGTFKPSPVFSLLLLFIFLSACSVGPKYKTPPAPVPPAFKENSEWKQAEPQDTELRGAWWEIFSEPELSAFEVQVDVSNQNIAAAEARFRAARAAIRVANADRLPTVTVGAAATTSRTAASNRPGFSAGTGTFYQLPIDLTYEADLWGRIRRNIEANVTA